MISDLPANEADKITWLHKQFNIKRRLLITGNAHQLDRPDWELTLDATEHLAEILRTGTATSEIQAMLAAFLSELVISGDLKTAQALLDIPNIEGRPKKKLEELRAVDAYEVYIKAGESDELALEAAWRVYHGESNTEQAKKRPLGDSNAFHQSIEKTIKPLLHKSGVRKPNKAGRPKKIIN